LHHGAEETLLYLCLVYQEEAALDDLAEREHDALVAEILAYREELRERGHYVAANALQSVQAATTIRVRNGKVDITDGPFAETKEQLGGFYLINATDLNEAIRLAARMPPARLGSIEIRPIQELNASGCEPSQTVMGDG
jgi:hypothetical protein